jgi:hypothetical protein
LGHLLNQNSRLPEQHSLLRGAAEQVIAPKRETATFLMCQKRLFIRLFHNLFKICSSPIKSYFKTYLKNKISK